MHAVKVLRVKVGDTLHVTDGNGHLYETIVDTIGKKSVNLRVVNMQFTPKESLPILAVGILKSRDRLEWLVEKSVELGISKLILMQTERSERSHVREDRIRAIQISAMKQCLSSWLPDLEIGTQFSAVVASCAQSGSQMITAHEKVVANTPWPTRTSGHIVTYFVGPEGGFSDAEIQLAVDAGSSLVSLGTRRLRTETAALAMLVR